MSDDARRLELATEQCREAVREAHEAMKDLRIALAEQREFIRAHVDQAVRGELEAQVARQLQNLGIATETAMRANVAKVTQEFDRLAGIFLGTEDGGPTLDQLVRHHATVRARRGQ